MLIRLIYYYSFTMTYPYVFLICQNTMLFFDVDGITYFVILEKKYKRQKIVRIKNYIM